MKKILINERPWQTRVAIVNEFNVLQNIYFWSHTTNNLERSFFKGTVTKVLQGIQTAFVDIGQERAGFLHISEIDRELAFNRMTDGDSDSAAEKRSPLPDISTILQENTPLLVQVSKEPLNEKGAKLTTCFTLPGRFIVLMPNIPKIGISKKINDKDEQIRLKSLIQSLIPEGMGAIIRTCSENRKEEEIKQDVMFLVNIWLQIQKKERESQAPALLHQDTKLAFQIIRDHLSHDTEEVIIDDTEQQAVLAQYVKETAPEHYTKIRLYNQQQPLFEKYDIEEQIKAALDKKVSLKSGGSIVIETTEAMTVIDVNTGRYIGKSNLEDTLLKTNLEAAQEIVRQLKIRNIGGIIVIDFIDMNNPANRHKLFHTFERTLKEQDKSQSVLLRISEFGIVQMTRKRTGKTLEKELTDNCSHCHGSGVIPSVQAECYNVLRNIQRHLTEEHPPSEIVLKLHPLVFEYISTTEYNSLFSFEKKYSCKIILESIKTFSIPDFEIEKHH